jgi:asparagine synthase (glutamine-hydrolysing)
MCGIIGVLNLTNPLPISPERLQEGNDALSHRGPDDEGAFVQTKIGLAARRLSIIDLAQGHQPMTNEDGTVHVVYNGEIYNHNDLRRELESFGHRFRTRADTETILHGYEQWGPEGLLNKMRGMFAFAVWDDTKQALFLARDRMGIKPLYFAEYDGRLYFASEIRALLLQSQMPRRIYLPALDVFMKVGFVSSPHTLFEGIRKLPPAHYLWVRDGHISMCKYWELTYEMTNSGSEASIIEQFREKLQESIAIHLMSDVPLGALLSGGVDSTATVAFMRKALGKTFQTITIAFEDDGINEARLAATSANILGTEHHSILFTGDSMASYPSVLYFQEEPAARPTHIAMYHLFRACRERGLKVVLTGEGADELLGGYAWHGNELPERFISKLPQSMRSTFERNSWLRYLSQAGRNWMDSLCGVHRQAHYRYQSKIGRKDPAMVRDLLTLEVKSALGHAGQLILDSWADWMPSVKGRPSFEQVLWIQSRTRLPDYINHGLDRMSMAHSIEARPPFLDHKLWEFCAAISNRLKLHNRTEKYVLREAGKGLIPEAARRRRKAPLRVPYSKWIARPRLPQWAEAALSEAQLRRTGLFDSAAVLGLRQEIQSGNHRKGIVLMSVLAVQTWARIFLEDPLTNEPQYA